MRPVWKNVDCHFAEFDYALHYSIEFNRGSHDKAAIDTAPSQVLLRERGREGESISALNARTHSLSLPLPQPPSSLATALSLSLSLSHTHTHTRSLTNTLTLTLTLTHKHTQMMFSRKYLQYSERQKHQQKRLLNR